MFRRILVPLDGSAPAERALPVARRLALATGATLHLVRVIEPPQVAWAVGGGYLTYPRQEDAGAADTGPAPYLETVRGRLAVSGIAVCTACLAGEVVPQLLDYERRMGIDLVVLCARGHGGPARLALGSVASRLLRHGLAPVLLVRASGEPADLGHVVLPLDGSVEHEQALCLVARLAPVVRWVSLLRVVGTAGQAPEAERYLQRVADHLAQHGIQVAECRVAVGDPAAEIRAMAGAGQLVVMATQAHAPLTHWFAASVADRVVRNDTAAVLLLRTGMARPQPVYALAR